MSEKQHDRPDESGRPDGDTLPKEREAERELKRELEAVLELLGQLGEQANLGALSAGLAHEINNPIAFLHSNLGSLSRHIEKILTYTGHVTSGGAALAGVQDAHVRAFLEGAQRLRERLRLDFVLDDIGDLIKQSLGGLDRLQGIAKHLRAFSRRDASSRPLDLNEIVEGALALMHNELKYKATVKTEFGKLRQLQGSPVTLVQVLLNILLSAAEAIEREGTVWITTRMEGSMVRVEIRHDGRRLPDSVVAGLRSPSYRDLGPDRMQALRLHRAGRIVEDLVGQLRVETATGVDGVTVTVDLPADPVAT